MWKQVLKLLGVALAICMSGLSANAQVLYGANGAGGNPATVLVRINAATGVATPIGPIGFGVTGLAVHPLTGVLYGSVGDASPVSPDSIITINTTTGAGTLLGATGLGNSIADISFRADGTLFGWSEDTDELVTINTATGVATVVGPSGLSTSGSGIAFSPTGQLFFAGDGANGDLTLINPATGAPTVVATLTGSAFNNAINSMAFIGPTLFAVDFAGGGAAGLANLVTINTATGVITTIGATQPGLDAIALAPLAGGGAQNAPTLSEWSMILLGLALAGTAMWTLSKRRA